MSLSLFSTSLGYTLSRQLPRTAPLLVSRVNGALNHYNQGNTYIQKRTFLIGCLIHLSFDAVTLTTACAGLRRVVGLDMKTYVDRLDDPRWRGYLYRYLDFGELCADKLIHLFRKGKYEIEKENQKQQSYSDYERYRSNQRNSYDNGRGYH